MASIFPDIYGEHYMRIGLTVGLSLIGVVLMGHINGLNAAHLF